ncbi:hypothetical protein [Alienimonas sp. DA493]|uniref:hypothetical protein n=1 Tax=Alienimonas sp. DA493 TaxID=3373605 RepID=UPI0037552BFF
MTTLAEIEAAARRLSPEDQLRLCVRLAEYDMEDRPHDSEHDDLPKLTADRWAAYQRGELSASPAEDVIARMRAADAARRSTAPEAAKAEALDAA